VLIPEVDTKVLFPDNRDGVSYCIMLLHDTMLNEDAHRTGTCDSLICNCGMERELVENVLFQQVEGDHGCTIDSLWSSAQDRSLWRSLRPSLVKHSSE